MVEAFPLCWPVGYPRSNRAETPRFSRKTLSSVVNSIKAEVQRLGGQQLIISSNIPLRMDGMPRADYSRRITDDKGVAVYFMYKGKQVVIACDKWTTIEFNMNAIYLSIEAMRALERWGVSEILDRAFTGFHALPEGKPVEQKSCWEILDIPVTSDIATIKKAYREQSFKVHPDYNNGNSERFHELNDAYQDAIHFSNQIQ